MIDSNIGVFNEYVRIQVQSIAAQGQTTSDLLVNLFKRYTAASDQEFRAYVSCKQRDHDNNSSPTTAAQLMQLTKNLYNKLKQKKTWNSETVNEKLMVLQAQMQTMQKDYKRKSHEKKTAPLTHQKGGKKKDYAKNHNKWNDTDCDNPRNWPAPVNTLLEEKKESRV